MLGLGLLACPRGISSSHNWEQYSEATDEVFTEYRLRSISERTDPSNL